MTSREERADMAESEMLDRAEEVLIVFQHGVLHTGRVGRRDQFAVLEDFFGRKVALDAHHIRLAAMALGLSVVPAEQPDIEAHREAMGRNR